MTMVINAQIGIVICIFRIFESATGCFKGPLVRRNLSEGFLIIEVDTN